MVAAVARRYPELRRERGKKVFELRPDVAWDKGSAVAWLIEALALDPGAATYIGDDETDEHAFELLGGYGVPIVVEQGDRPTWARYRVHEPGEVNEVLELLIETLAGALTFSCRGSRSVTNNLRVRHDSANGAA